MPAPRRPATKQEIVDSFEILSLDDQSDILAELSQIHRILKRERERQPTQPIAQGALPTEWLTPPNAALEKRLATIHYGPHEQ